jgi:hypothetical protein
MTRDQALKASIKQWKQLVVSDEPLVVSDHESCVDAFHLCKDFYDGSCTKCPMYGHWRHEVDAGYWSITDNGGVATCEDHGSPYDTWSAYAFSGRTAEHRAEARAAARRMVEVLERRLQEAT